VARSLVIVLVGVLLACAHAPTSTPDPVSNRQRRVEETFTCAGLADLQIYISVGELRADFSTPSGFALSGTRVETEEPAIVGATVGTAERRIAGLAPKIGDNYVRFYFSPVVRDRLATATQSVENPGSGVTVHVVRDGAPLYTATAVAPLPDGSAEVHMSHRNLELADKFISTQQRRLCPEPARTRPAT